MKLSCIFVPTKRNIMNYKELCKRIDSIFKSKKESLVMIEGVKNNKGYFICQGKSKVDLSGGFLNFRLNNSIKSMKFYVTEL